MSERDELLAALESVYRDLLVVPHRGASRLAHLQRPLATCLDAIAIATGRDAEEVQVEFERAATLTLETRAKPPRGAAP